MAKNKKTKEMLGDETAFTDEPLCGGAFDDEIEDEDSDTSFNGSIFFSVGRHARTFNLPLEDVTYGKLLNYEKEGKATILIKQYCPCPKEGYILVMCEYDINF